jgi:hypothetical protein
MEKLLNIIIVLGLLVIIISAIYIILTGGFKVPFQEEINICEDNGGIPIYEKYCGKGCSYKFIGCIK